MLAGIVVAKARFLPLVLRERWLLPTTFVAFAVLAWYVRRAMRAPPAPSVVAAFVAALILAANLANTPLA